MVSSVRKYFGKPRWTKPPSGNGKRSRKVKLTMLKTITAETIPVVVQ
jgi:hypothetical protein